MTSPLVTGLVRCLDGFDPRISSVVLSTEKFSDNLKLTNEDLSLLFAALLKNWTVTTVDLFKHAGSAVKFSLNEERPFLKILGSHPFKLLELRADGACMRKYDAFLLRSYLSVSGSLVRLDISCSRLRAVGASILCDGLKVNKTLLHLGLSANKLDSSSAKFLSEVLKVHPNLFYLDLSGNLIGPAGAKHIAAALIVTSSLGHLNISGNAIGNSGVIDICDALRFNYTIKILDTSSNRIDSSEAFESLANSLRQNSIIQKVKLSGNSLPSSCFDWFESESDQFSINFLDVSNMIVSGSALRKLSFDSLVQLNLSGCKIGDDVASEISYLISASATMKELSLLDNCITATGAAPIGKALQSNRKLERLSLSSNPLGNAGFKIMCKCLESNRTLLYFYCENCELNEESSVFLKSLLSTNSSIIGLNLASNTFSSYSAASNISIGLNSNRNFELLDLRQCRISSGISQICDALKSNRVFKHLDVFGNMIDESSCESIAQFIASSQSVTYLDLSSNNLNNQGFAHVTRALQTNKSLLYVGLSNSEIDEVDALTATLRANSTLQKVSVYDRGSFGTIFSDSRVCCKLDISRGEEAFFSSTEPAMFKSLSKTVSQFISSSVTASSFFIFEELKMLPQLFAQEDIKFFVHGLSKLFHDRGVGYHEFQCMTHSTFRSIIPSKLQIDEEQFKLFQCRVRSASVLVISDIDISYGPVVYKQCSSGFIVHSGSFRGIPVYIQLFQVETSFDKMLTLVQRLVTLRVSGFRNIVNYIALIQNSDRCVGLVIGRVVHSAQDVQKFQSMRSLILADCELPSCSLNWIHKYYMCLGAAEGVHALVCSPPPLPEGWTQHFDSERRACFFLKAGANKTFKRPSFTPIAPPLNKPMVTSDSIFVDHQHCAQVSFLGQESLTQDVAMRTIRCVLVDVALGCTFDLEELYELLFSCDGEDGVFEEIIKAHADQIPPQFFALLKKCFSDSGPLLSLTSIIHDLRVLSKYDASIPAKLPDFCRDFVCVYFQWNDSLPHLSTEQLSIRCSRVGDLSFCRSISSDDFGNRGYVYFSRISTYNLDEIVLQCFRREASSVQASFFLEPSNEPNFSQELTASAVERRGARMGHPGEWRDHSLDPGQKGYLSKYCSRESAEEGSLCRHGTDSISDSHWSCCGSKDFLSECTGHRGHTVSASESCKSCRHQQIGCRSHWSCCGSNVDDARCPSSAKCMALKGVPKSDATEALIRLLPFGSNCLIFGSYALWLFEEGRGSRPNWLPGDCDFFCLNVTTEELKNMAHNFCMRAKSSLNIDLESSQINQNLISICFSGSTLRVNETKISFVRSSFPSLSELQATIDISVARVGVRIKPANGIRSFIMPARTLDDIEAGTMSWVMDPYMDTRSPQAQYFTEKLLPRLLKYMRRGYFLNRMETKLTAIDSFIFSYDEKDPIVDVVSEGRVSRRLSESEGSNHWGGSGNEGSHRSGSEGSNHRGGSNDEGSHGSGTPPPSEGSNHWGGSNDEGSHRSGSDDEGTGHTGSWRD